MSFLGAALEHHQLGLVQDPRARRKAFEKLNHNITDSSVGQWRNKISSEQAGTIWKKSGGLYRKALAELLMSSGVVIDI